MMMSLTSPVAMASFAPKIRTSAAVPQSRRTSRISASFASSTVERPTKASSLYEVLGIRTEATCQEIKSAYRRLARVVHPDVSHGEASSAAVEFMRVHEAYSTLSDPEKRADYDRSMYGRRWSDATLRSPSYGSGFYSGTYTTARSWETDQCW